MSKTSKKPALVAPSKPQKKALQKATAVAPKQPVPQKKVVTVAKAIAAPTLPSPTPKKVVKRSVVKRPTPKPVAVQPAPQRLVTKVTIGAPAPQKIVAPPFPAPVPPPSRPANPYQGLIGTACVIAVFAVGLFALIKIANPPSVGSFVRTITKNMPDAIATNETFVDWLDDWKKVDPYISRGEFVSSGSAPFAFKTGVVAYPNTEDLQLPRANRYVWSPDNTKFVDYLSKYPDYPDVATVYGHAGTILETLDHPCDVECVLDGAFWTTPTRFVLLARIPAMKTDGSKLCVGADEENAPKCYEKLLVAAYDLESGRRTNYISGPHFFVTHPIDAKRRSEWVSGLSEEEQIGLGVVQPESTYLSTGAITSLSLEDSAATFVLDAGKLGEQPVKILSATRFRDERGETVTAKELRSGFIVAVSGLMAVDGSLVADKVSIVSRPRVIVTAPRGETTIGNTADLVISAMRDSWPITMTVTDVAADKTIASRTFSAPKATRGDTYLDLTHTMKFAKLNLTSGDELHFSLVPAKGDGAVEFDLLYQP